MPDNILANRLRGTRGSQIAEEFFGNSAHFPVANIFLEMLLASPWMYLLDLDFYFLVLGSLAQAYWAGSWQYAGKPKPLLGNLIGPLVYTCGEVALDGLAFFHSPHHWAYWGFALAIGILQTLRLYLPEKAGGFIIILENLARTGISLAMYAIFEVLSRPSYTWQSFFDDESHVFILLVLGFLGILLGVANRNSAAYLALLRSTSEQLRKYSEWLLGRKMLAQAVIDPAALSLSRQERAVLFMDIRGFTAWSEKQPPEQVVAMLNEYFALGETCWNDANPIKVKFTGDEIMLVLEQPASAVAIAQRLSREVARLLDRYGLKAGTGIHAGAVVEGLLGSGQVKAYDIIGDTVNTAKRLCDAAAGGEILLSRQAVDRLPAPPASSETRDIQAKGKAAPVRVLVLAGLE
jgi:class 3 adenylate cyclase